MRPSEVLRLRVGDIDSSSLCSITKSRHIGEEKRPKDRREQPHDQTLSRCGRNAGAHQGASGNRDRLLFHEQRSARRSIRTNGGRITGTRRSGPKITERNFYITRHTFISLAPTAGENIKGHRRTLRHVGQMIEQHYGRYMRSDFGERLMAKSPTAKLKYQVKWYEGDFATAQNGSNTVASPTGFEPVLSA